MWTGNNDGQVRQESFWDIRDTGLGSWVRRRLLQLRPIAKQFFRLEIHNGQTTRFWTDLWHPLGRLIEVAGEIETQKLGIARNALVCEVWNAGHWVFRRCRDRQMSDMILAVESHTLVDDRTGPDIALWKRGPNEFRKIFSTADTWQQIRTHSPTTAWSKVIWFSLGVPRFGFITWLAIRNKLSTGDRMRAWGLTQGCLFCGEPNESRDHLFFACPYTYTLWLEVVGTLMGRPPDPDWETTLHLLATHNFDRLAYVLLRLVFQVTIYMIWRERNDKKHHKRPRQASQLAEVIGRAVKNRLLSVKYWEKPHLRGLMQRWFHAHS
ncbi:uncharacterized protein LOC125592010 [Brassica napus]|uniref:uncharacterized protein LOC125592010 n=1 Tax=Brassica napus TaxID=3708 RepID=UPI0020792B40|nr:uncharacterized protein LOC125592010 [Brassica napus]